MKIVKHSGDIVEYNPLKLQNSLLKSGANQAVIKEIMQTIEHEIYEGMPTKQIYKLAFGHLKKASNSHAARYNLRQAIQLLGPAGFFFEKYVARLFAAEHYDTQINLILQGKCVSHEVDVAIRKYDNVAMVECKFHSSREATSDVKIPMYILSRFNDLKEKKHKIFSQKDTISKCWIVTNNRFTSDAVTFATCSGMSLLSWDYPKEANIRTKIDSNFLYPITCLTTLSLVEKDKLLILDVILVKEIINNSHYLEKIGLSSNRIKNVLKESTELCQYI
jgi:translation initiation factor 2 beta subunit (eIF-2beta)/eIF-5